jgi:hypothetical protein
VPVGHALRALKVEDLVEETPPSSQEATTEAVEALLLEIIDAKPNVWLKVPGLFTVTAKKYFGAAGAELGLRVQSRFVRVGAGNQGNLWVKVSEEEA